jgi:hypothetical protein
MTDMIELVEEMRAKIGQIASAEEELVGSLRDALSRVDDKLLREVRTITTDHEARRGHSLHELRRLSSRIGTFPAAHATMSAVEDARPQATPIAAGDGTAVVSGFRHGDWRQATGNVEHALEEFCEARARAPR